MISNRLSQLARQAIVAVLALTLWSCATYNPPAPSKFVVNGQLTQEGKQLRDRGIEFYQSHDDAKAYEVWRILADQGHGESLRGGSGCLDRKVAFVKC